jgi:hypothetical protein
VHRFVRPAPLEWALLHYENGGLMKKKALLITAAACLIAAGSATGGVLSASRFFLATNHDVMVVRDAKIACSVGKTKGVTTVSCFRFKDPTHIAAGSYGVGMSKKNVVVIKYVSFKKRKVVFRHSQ